MNKGTLNQLFFTTVERHADLPFAFRSKVAGMWVPIRHREASQRVQAISLGLRELGVQPGDRVAIVSENRPEWALTDYACLAARAADVPIYPTLTPKQTEYILHDSESVVVCCSTDAQVAKVLDVRSGLPGLKHVIAFDASVRREGVLTLAEVEAKGRAAIGKYPDWTPQLALELMDSHGIEVRKHALAFHIADEIGIDRRNPSEYPRHTAGFP